jgi:hypothetical protein
MPISASARTTVFCAVWSGDPDRWELLRAHQANLERQSVPVSVVSVFDAGDEPPAWVRGVRVIAARPLTIYQAWNVATQVAETELVMNLNLDDRLGPDAVALLEDSISVNGAALAGGDWRICYSQADTDAVGDAVPARTLPFRPEWPPEPGTVTRLGSGTGERGTFGPATMWRRSLHEKVAYPWELTSGRSIRIVGDLAWWTIVAKHLKARTLKLPVLIGNYHSHPGEQAEFRSADEHEVLAREGVRASNHPLDDIRIRKEAS